MRTIKLMLLAGLTLAASQLHAASNALIDISHITLPGNKQQLALTMSGPAQTPKAFTIDNPARIALDLPDTTNQLDEKNLRISAGLLQNVTTVEAGGRTRVVVNLASMIPYQTAVVGNQLLVTLDSDGTGTATPTTTVESDQPLVRADGVSAAGVKQINKIDFRRGPMGEGRIIFDLSNSASLPTCARKVEESS